MLVNAIFNFSKLSKDVAGIIKIAKNIEIHGLEKKIELRFTTKGFELNMFPGKKAK